MFNHTTKDASQTTSNIQPCNEPRCLFTLFFGSTSTSIHLIDHFDHHNHHPVTLTRTSHGPTDVAVVSLILMEKTKILWCFFHSTTMTLQSVTICNSALSQSTWKRPSTTFTFHPLPSNIILLSPYHVFFNCQLADSFYERIRCRNHGWKVHQSRRKSTPLTMEHGLDMW